MKEIEKLGGNCPACHKKECVMMACQPQKDIPLVDKEGTMKEIEKIEEIKSLLYHEHYITGGYIDSLDMLALVILKYTNKRVLEGRVEGMERAKRLLKEKEHLQTQLKEIDDGA